VLITSHATWIAWLRKDEEQLGWAVVGAVAPDLSAMAAAAIALARGGPRGELLERMYSRSPWREIHLGAHSVWPLLALAPLGRSDARLRRVAEGYLSHLVIDGLTHHDDAWPPLWPLWRGRWRAPVSYWQPQHHARALALVDLIPLGLALRHGPRRLSFLLLGIATAALRAGRPVRRPARCRGRARDAIASSSRADAVHASRADAANAP
jgi:hypothetical protein